MCVIHMQCIIQSNFHIVKWWHSGGGRTRHSVYKCPPLSIRTVRQLFVRFWVMWYSRISFNRPSADLRPAGLEGIWSWLSFGRYILRFSQRHALRLQRSARIGYCCPKTILAILGFSLQTGYSDHAETFPLNSALSPRVLMVEDKMSKTNRRTRRVSEDKTS